MKISYNWLKPWLAPKAAALTPAELAAVLTATGLEVEGTEHVQSVPGGLKNVVTARVLSCVKHPDADRLRVTTVDAGDGEIRTIVCGAPNVAEGQVVVAALPGAELHPVSGGSITIKQSKIRGQESMGMLCAEDELGLGESHDGIMVLPEGTPAGMPAAEYFKLEDDIVFEIGLTPNRGDAASHLGAARDANAYFGEETPRHFNAAAGGAGGSDISIEVKDNGACRRYSALQLEDVKVGPAPDWMQQRLKAIGLKPINNVVDITNYVLHSIGQPMHAFDTAKIAGGKIIVDRAAAGETFITLDGAEHEMDGSELMVKNANASMCIAGVFGGLESGISNDTTGVMLEAAYFDAVAVRQAAKRLGLKTDSSFRFERGTDPEMTLNALNMAADLLVEYAGAKVKGGVQDVYPMPVEPARFTVKYDNINRLIGEEIAPEKVRSILTGLGIKVQETEGGLAVEVPAFKADVTREVDITEEIIRIYGLDNIAIPATFTAAMTVSAKPDKELYVNTIADMLSAMGFYEMYNNSLTRLAYSPVPEAAVEILNPLSTDLNAMRQSMLPGMLEGLVFNLNRQREDLRFYELGKVYTQQDGGYKEEFCLSLCVAGYRNPENWTGNRMPADFYWLRNVCEQVLVKMGIGGYTAEDSQCDELSWGLTYRRGPMELLSVGAIAEKWQAAFKTTVPVYYAVFKWDVLMKMVAKAKVVNADTQKYPAVRRDLSLLVDDATKYSELQQVIARTEKKLVQGVNIFDVYRGDKLPEGKKSYAVAIALYDSAQTLTDKAINQVMEKITQALEKVPGLEIRK